MRARLSGLCLIALLEGCTTVPLPDTATVAPYAFGSNQDAETTAINVSAWIFADPARARNDPTDVARAVAGVDYLAGQLYSNPRWTGISPLIKQQMLDARIEVRQAIGIAPDARSQEVVNGLLGAASAMQMGDQAAARTALSSPVFTLGGARTYNRLLALPFLRTANIATQRLNGSLNGQNDVACPGCG